MRALATPGHTPGHQSFLIRLDSAAAREYGAPGFVLAFDAADLQRNVDEEIAPGGLIGHTPEEAVESIRRLKRGLARLPGHPGPRPARVAGLHTARTHLPEAALTPHTAPPSATGPLPTGFHGSETPPTIDGDLVTLE